MGLLCASDPTQLRAAEDPPSHPLTLFQAFPSSPTDLPQRRLALASRLISVLDEHLSLGHDIGVLLSDGFPLVFELWKEADNVEEMLEFLARKYE